MERRFISRVMIAGFALVLGSTGCQQTAPGSGSADSGDFDADTGAIEVVETVELTDLQTIYFDFDQSAIRPDQRDGLRSDAEAIKASPELKVITLEGNCDERGSEEYNLALGERRANSVKSYLVDLGVPASRLRTVSFGESKPAVAGHDESAWKWNRRVDFVATR